MRNMVYSYRLVALNMGENFYKDKLLVHPSLEIFLNSIKQPQLCRAIVGLAEENLTIISLTLVFVLR